MLGLKFQSRAWGVGKVKGGKVYNSNHQAEAQSTGFMMKGDERSQRKVL